MTKSRIELRRLTVEDQREFLAGVARSRALHHPWVSPPSTPAQYRAYVERMASEPNLGFLVCERGSGAIAGVINITNIVMGLFRSGYLGYYVFSGYERRGFMREGLNAVIREAFGNVKLHRLEANIQPGNTASIALVKACGFSREGYSPRYLKIGGRWRDHVRWAILAD